MHGIVYKREEGKQKYPFLKEIFQKWTKGNGTKPSIPPAVTGQDYDKPFIVKLYCFTIFKI